MDADSSPTLISVIVPAFDAAATLAETLASIAAQRHRAIEILIVDDGSTDDTGAIARAFCAAEPRARVITRDNGGVAAARNSGIAAARGRFVAPIDADDLWHPDYLCKLVARALAAHPTPTLIYAPCRLIDQASRVVGSGLNAGVEGAAPYRMMYANLVGNGSGMLIAREAAIAAGGYDVRLRAAGCEGYEDYLLQLMLASTGPVATVGEYLVGYRQRDGAMSADQARMARSQRLARTIHAEATTLAAPPGWMARWMGGRRLLLLAGAQAGAQGDGGRVTAAVGSLARALLHDPVAAAVAVAGRARSTVLPGRRLAPPHFRDVDPTTPDGGGLLGRSTLPRWFARLQLRRLQRIAALDRGALLPAVIVAPTFVTQAASPPAVAPAVKASQPAVSVVLPVHNGARYVELSIRSILAQTFTDYEIIVGDDGSDDGTDVILDRLRREFPAIQVVRRDRKSGLSNAANFVVSHARGDLVAVAHADDLAYPERLARQVGVLAEHRDAVLVGSPAAGIDPHGVEIHPANLWRVTHPTVFAPFAHSSVMFRRAAFSDVGGYRPQADFWEDLDLYWRLAGIGKLLVLPHALTAYRYSSDSARERDDAGRVERSLQRMYDRAHAAARQGGAEPEDAEHGRLHPRVFVARSWLHVWTGQRTNVLPRLLRHGDLRWNGATAQALIFVVWATLAPRLLRHLLRTATRARNRLVRRKAPPLVPIVWRPFDPS